VQCPEANEPLENPAVFWYNKLVGSSQVVHYDLAQLLKHLHLSTLNQRPNIDGVGMIMFGLIEYVAARASRLHPMLLSSGVICRASLGSTYLALLAPRDTVHARFPLHAPAIAIRPFELLFRDAGRRCSSDPCQCSHIAPTQTGAVPSIGCIHGSLHSRLSALAHRSWKGIFAYAWG